MELDIKTTALILEGGGMRGVFTAGILDYFMDNGMWFPYTIAVSAGASNGISYASRQRGRARYSDVDLLKIRPYVGMKHLLRGRGLIDLQFIFYEYPDKYYPLDYDTYFNSKDRFVVVTSNCLTGKACYFEEKKDKDRLIDILRASCSLPYVSPKAYVDKIPMLDGGICDALPIHKAIEEGYEKFVVVLTRPLGYRKPDQLRNIPHFIYRKYPKLKEQLRTRYKRYNQTMDFIEKLEKEGKAIVIRPVEPLKVERIDTDTEKLDAFYKEGYETATETFKPFESVIQENKKD